MTRRSIRTAQSQGTGHAGGLQSSRVDGVYTKTADTQRVVTSSLAMEVEARTHAMQWLASQTDAQRTDAIILIVSMNLVESGMGCPEQHTTMRNLWLQRLL